MLGIDFVNVFVHHDESATNYTAQLLRLMAKADLKNKIKLAVVYPEAAELYEWWMNQPEPPTVGAIMAKAKEVCGD